LLGETGEKEENIFNHMVRKRNAHVEKAVVWRKAQTGAKHGSYLKAWLFRHNSTRRTFNIYWTVGYQI